MHDFKITKEYRKKLNSITAKRARTVIQHILKHGHITTEQLQNVYGYDHPPRAIRDVREAGIPLVTFQETGSHGRKIGAYKFADPTTVAGGKLSGRVTWPKGLKKRIAEAVGVKCTVCAAEYGLRYLQIDHRIPYEVGGDAESVEEVRHYMLLCSSCNTAKAWSCRNCPNTTAKNQKVCETCYWANPDCHNHVATLAIRRADLTWVGKEIGTHTRLLELASEAQIGLPEYIKAILEQIASDDEPSCGE